MMNSFPQTEAEGQAVRRATRIIIAATEDAARRYGWMAAIAALPNALIPLLASIGTVAQAQFVLRGLADQAPAIIASWEVQCGPLAPPAGHA